MPSASPSSARSGDLQRLGHGVQALMAEAVASWSGCPASSAGACPRLPSGTGAVVLEGLPAGQLRRWGDSVLGGLYAASSRGPGRQPGAHVVGQGRE